MNKCQFNPLLCLKPNFRGNSYPLDHEVLTCALELPALRPVYAAECAESCVAIVKLEELAKDKILVFASSKKKKMTWLSKRRLKSARPKSRGDISEQNRSLSYCENENPLGLHSMSTDREAGQEAVDSGLMYLQCDDEALGFERSGTFPATCFC